MGTLDGLLKTLDEFLNMKPNWDSYGADAPTAKGVERGKALARAIYEETGLIPNGAGPLNDGKGIVFEWFPWKDRDCVIVDIDGDWKCGILLPNGEEYENISIADICSYLNRYKTENRL